MWCPRGGAGAGGVGQPMDVTDVFGCLLGQCLRVSDVELSGGEMRRVAVIDCSSRALVGGARYFPRFMQWLEEFMIIADAWAAAPPRDPPRARSRAGSGALGSPRAPDDPTIFEVVLPIYLSLRHNNITDDNVRALVGMLCVAYAEEWPGQVVALDVSGNCRISDEGGRLLRLLARTAVVLTYVCLELTSVNQAVARHIVAATESNQTRQRSGARVSRTRAGGPGGHAPGTLRSDREPPGVVAGDPAVLQPPLAMTIAGRAAAAGTCVRAVVERACARSTLPHITPLEQLSTLPSPWERVERARQAGGAEEPRGDSPSGATTSPSGAAVSRPVADPPSATDADPRHHWLHSLCLGAPAEAIPSLRLLYAAWRGVSFL